MKKEELIKKWLDHDLSSEEQRVFEQLDEFEQLKKIDNGLKSIDAPEFNAKDEFSKLQLGEKHVKPNGMKLLNSVIRIAAVVVLGVSIFYYVINSDTKILTEIAQQSSIVLPDNSTVKLNASSSISYNKWFWDSNRDISLEGEAFFKVAKGKKFNVITEDGIVSVLGTEFNVKQRDGIFDVTCFEGKVAVEHNNTSLTLSPGMSFTIIDGKQVAKKNDTSRQPTWLWGESQFSSVPLKYVLMELESQYNVEVDHQGIDTSRLFSGSFSNKNLELALKSISIPLNLNYEIKGNTIILARE
ncbi:FecR family protein [Winogradskyella pelagia]|nr:FecR family protein [Winogradskyella sp. DF17]